MSEEHVKHSNEFAKNKHPGMVGVEILSVEPDEVTGRMPVTAEVVTSGELVFENGSELPIVPQCAWFRIELNQIRQSIWIRRSNVLLSFVHPEFCLSAQFCGVHVAFSF